MQTGDVIFFRAQDTFVSRTIAKMTDFPYTHVALAIDSETIIEADRFIKTRVVPFKLDDTQHVIYRVPGLTDEDRASIKERALRYSGYPYDYLQIFSWAFQLVFKRESSFFNRANKLICSELIDYAYIGTVKRNASDRLGNLMPSMLLQYYDLQVEQEVKLSL